MVVKIFQNVSDSGQQQLRKDVVDILIQSGLEFVEEILNIQQLTGGTSNTIYLVNINSSVKVLFRLNGVGSENFIDRNQEIENMKLLAKYNLGAPLVAEFNNGICYHYVNGRSLSNADIFKEEIYSLVAEKLAKIHNIPMESKQNVLWSKTKNLINLISEFENNEHYGNGIFNCKNDLVKEFHFLKSLLENCDSPIVFCHLDLNLPNILYDGTEVHFIDVEYSGCSYAAFDIANHFVEFVGFEENILDYERWYPDKKFQLSWLRKYFAVFTENISEAQIESTYQLVQQFVLCSHLMWGAWSLVQSQVSKINFNFKDFAHQRFLEYARMKNIVIKT